MKKIKKSLTDPEILQNVIDAIGVRIPEFRTKIGYATNTTIYNVMKGVNGISSDMINRILNKYPEVSYLYLKRGEGHPIRVGQLVKSYNPIAELYDKNSFINIYDFLKIPAMVEELKNKVSELEVQIEKLKSGK